MVGKYDETIKALQQRLHTYDTTRATQRLSDAVVRGAAAGIAIRGSLNLVSYILSIFSKNQKRSSARPTGWELVKDSLKYGAFLGSCTGIYVGADEIIAMLGGRKKTSAWRSIASGALAGPTILILGPESHTSLSLYLFIRGLTLLVRCGNLPSAPQWKRQLLTPTRWQHGDVLLMCFSSAQLLYSWIVLPQTLPLSYVRFLDKHAGKDPILYDAFREMVTRAASGLPPGGHLSTLQGHPHYKDFDDIIPCSIIHPGDSCNTHALSFLPAGFLRALPVYLPVYIVPAALVHRQRLIQKETAKELWIKIAKGVARSSLFLSLYCTLAWRGACAGWQGTKTTTGRNIALGCWISGLATFVEKKSRRMELALYCVSRALESFGLSLMAMGIINPKSVPRRLDVVLFSAALAAICHCYSDHFGKRRDVFRSKYLTVFDFVLGNQGFSGAAIRHTPSNMDLLLMAGQAVENTAMVPRALSLVRSAANLAGLSEEEAGYHPLLELRSDSSDDDEK